MAKEKPCIFVAEEAECDNTLLIGAYKGVTARDDNIEISERDFLSTLGLKLEPTKYYFKLEPVPKANKSSIKIERRGYLSGRIIFPNKRTEDICSIEEVGRLLGVDFSDKKRPQYFNVQLVDKSGKKLRSK